MSELKHHNMDLPPPPGIEEAPELFRESDFKPTLQQKLGLQTSISGLFFTLLI